jgi:hypothetical protein
MAPPNPPIIAAVAGPPNRPPIPLPNKIPRPPPESLPIPVCFSISVITFNFSASDCASWNFLATSGKSFCNFSVTF